MPSFCDMPVEVYRDEREVQRDGLVTQAGFGTDADLRIARFSENVDLARVHAGSPYHTSCFLLSGGMTRVDRPMATLTRGCVTVEPTWFEGTFTNEGPTDWLMVYIKAERLTEMASEMAGTFEDSDLKRMHGGPEPILSSLIRACADSTLYSGGTSRLELDGWAQVIGARLLKYHSEATVRDDPSALSDRALSILYDVIEDDLDGDLSLASLAHILDLSTTRLSQGFRISTGKTVHQYVQERRVELARDLVESTDRSLAAIAFEVGFSSQSHMTAVFRDHLGVTPGKYRRLRR
ncbi:MAG: AraC family transcriptional regulator [Pseudomonadota bacterium]